MADAGSSEEHRPILTPIPLARGYNPSPYAPYACATSEVEAWLATRHARAGGRDGRGSYKPTRYAGDPGLRRVVPEEAPAATGPARAPVAWKAARAARGRPSTLARRARSVEGDGGRARD